MLSVQVLMAAMQESKGTGGGGGAQESLISLVRTLHSSFIIDPRLQYNCSQCTMGELNDIVPGSKRTTGSFSWYG